MRAFRFDYGFVTLVVFRPWFLPVLQLKKGVLKMSSRTKSTFLVNQRALKALVSTYAFSISDVIPASVKLEVLKCLYAEALALEREKLPRSNIGDFLTVWRFFLEPLVFFLAFTNFAKPVLGGSFN